MRGAFDDAGLLHVGADGDAAERVSVVEVVFEIEFVEMEWGEEGCPGGWRVRGAEEGEGEVGAGELE